MIPLINSIRDAVLGHGFVWFDKPESPRDWDLQIVAIRSPEREAGHFDDSLCCIYRAAGELRIHVWPCTTDPGRALLLARPCSVISHPQQARGAYNIGLHKGRPALVQHSGPVKAWLDGNRDSLVDYEPNPGKPGWRGLNIHNTLCIDGVSTRNDRSSLGCIVLPVQGDEISLRLLAHRQVKAGIGKTFTLTVIHEADLG